MDDLPPPNTTRWVARRKAAVVAAVRSGRITMEEALRRYQLTEEELRSEEVRAFVDFLTEKFARDSFKGMRSASSSGRRRAKQVAVVV